MKNESSDLVKWIDSMKSYRQYVNCSTFLLIFPPILGAVILIIAVAEIIVGWNFSVPPSFNSTVLVNRTDHELEVLTTVVYIMDGLEIFLSFLPISVALFFYCSGSRCLKKVIWEIKEDENNFDVENDTTTSLLPNETKSRINAKRKRLLRWQLFTHTCYVIMFSLIAAMNIFQLIYFLSVDDYNTRYFLSIFNGVEVILIVIIFTSLIISVGCSVRMYNDIDAKTHEVLNKIDKEGKKEKEEDKEKEKDVEKEEILISSDD